MTLAMMATPSASRAICHHCESATNTHSAPTNHNPIIGMNSSTKASTASTSGKGTPITHMPKPIRIAMARQSKS